MKKKKILIFTGSGISKESGLRTFRDSDDGMWNEYKVDEIAHIDAWKKDPEKILSFYNKIRSEYSNTKPNDAHNIVYELEKYFDVSVITQNVDILHEMAGSSNVIHLHGRIDQKCSSKNTSIKYAWGNEEINIGDKCELNSQLRPDICFFGEDLDFMTMHKVKEAAEDAVACIIIGTSMQVQPAASIPWLTKETTLIYYIDPSEVEFYIPTLRSYFFYHFKEKATIGTKMVFDDLFKIFIKNQKND